MNPLSKFAPFFACAIFAGSASAATLIGKVVGVSDGDTVTVLDANRERHQIRLLGIDAPESNQAYGAKSKAHLSDLVFSKTVTVEWNKYDNPKYQRKLGKILVNGIDANYEQVRAGFAWHYKQFQGDQSLPDRFKYATAELDARSKRLGLWQDPVPVAPWTYRHNPIAKQLARQEPAPPHYNGQTNTACSCEANLTCTGPHGGIYCIAQDGRKQYQRRY